MKNMKKILGALTALSFVTVAGVSTVACNACSKKGSSQNMDNQVLNDLGLYKDGKPDVSATITMADNKATWSADAAKGKTAGDLLKADNTAKDEHAYNFLTDVLKLTATGEGDWSKKTFDADAAKAITLNIDAVSPTVKVNADKTDYVVSGGNFTAKWMQDTTQLGPEYSIDLKADETQGVVASHLPDALDLNADFDTTRAPLSNFAVGKPKTGISVNADISNSLKTDGTNAKVIKALADLINQKIKVVVTAVNAKGEDFADGDTLGVKVSLGDVQFSKEYTLTLGS